MPRSDELTAMFHPGLGEDGVDVVLHRVERDRQRQGDLSVREPADDEERDLALAKRQLVEVDPGTRLDIDDRAFASTIDGDLVSGLAEGRHLTGWELGRPLVDNIEQPLDRSSDAGLDHTCEGTGHDWHR